MPLSRRRFLGLGALAGTSAVLGSASKGLLPAGAAEDGLPLTATGEAASLHGPHQRAVLSPAAASTAYVAFDVTAGSRAELEELLRTITARVRLLYRGGLPADAGPAAPADDNGILGPVPPPASVAFLVGLGASLFDGRFGLAGQRPARLSAMRSFPNDNLDAGQTHGDLGVQILASHPDLVIHALRDLTKHTRGAMQPRWRVDAFTSGPRPSGTPRNLLGFKDGIANPDVAQDAVARELVWVQPGGAEPAWAAGGTYQVVRIIRMLAEFWDRVSISEQENMIGRRRDTGAPLDGTGEFSTPRYADDPNGEIIRLDAHIRLANPRTDGTAMSRILRRGYNYDRGIDAVGNLDQGLLFTCYQRDIVRQFEATQKRLIDEPLVDYISPVGGGYFFCPPGLHDGDDYYASGLFV